MKIKKKPLKSKKTTPTKPLKPKKKLTRKKSKKAIKPRQTPAFTSPDFGQSPKFDLGLNFEEQPKYEFKLPTRYFDNRIVAMVRDPWWLHTYWDISPEKDKQVLLSIPLAKRKNLKRVLRVHDLNGVSKFTGSNANSFFDVEINDTACNWYINVNKPDTSFCIDIGFLDSDGLFYLILRSNIVTTPYFGMSQLLSQDLTLSDHDYFNTLSSYDLGKSSLQRQKEIRPKLKPGPK